MEHEQVVFHNISLVRDETTQQAQLDSVRQLEPDVILTVGSAATAAAKDAFPDIPIVFSSVMYPVVSGFVETFQSPGGNITGASLDIPPHIQFRYFRQLNPDLQSIGVLYSSHTAALIPEAEAIATGMGLHLVAIEVTSPRDLPRALDSLSRTTEGLWSLADPVLFSPQSTKFILMHALKRNLPLMGFSRNVVESGALFALDFDYKAIGRQAGGTVNRVLKGEAPNHVPITTPDIIWFHYNEMTAERMKITIPPELVAVAKEVYR